MMAFVSSMGMTKPTAPTMKRAERPALSLTISSKAHTAKSITATGIRALMHQWHFIIFSAVGVRADREKAALYSAAL